jgi:hypothetical protein
MSNRDMPIEGDCDLCGTPIPETDIPRLFNRQSGNLTCDQCAKLATHYRSEFEEL